VQGLIYTSNEQLSAMFIKLLSCTIDKDKKHLTHQAFPQLISQLHPDEARLLYKIKLHDKEFAIANYNKGVNITVSDVTYNPVYEDSKLKEERLSAETKKSEAKQVELEKNKKLIDNSIFELSKNLEVKENLLMYIEHLESLGVLNISRINTNSEPYKIALSEFGKTFINACLSGIIPEFET
jgi:hypothetical protein